MVNICNVRTYFSALCVDIIVIFSHCRSRFSNKALLLCLKKFLLGKVWSEGGEFSENFPIGVWIINGKLMRSVIPRIIIKFIFTTFTITRSPLELKTKAIRRFPKISQSRRRSLLGPFPGWKRLKCENTKALSTRRRP